MSKARKAKAAKPPKPPGEGWLWFGALNSWGKLGIHSAESIAADIRAAKRRAAKRRRSRKVREPSRARARAAAA